MLSDGLQDWIRGVPSYEAEAAGSLLAETLIMWRRHLETKFQKSPKG